MSVKHRRRQRASGGLIIATLVGQRIVFTTSLPLRGVLVSRQFYRFSSQAAVTARSNGRQVCMVLPLSLSLINSLRQFVILRNWSHSGDYKASLLPSRVVRPSWTFCQSQLSDWSVHSSTIVQMAKRRRLPPPQG